MSVVKILLTHPDADEFEPLAHDDAQYEFSKITSRAPSQIFGGPIWIFIDWVLDDLAGLELCRRLRADPQTAGAHITMVLNDDDCAARKRALDAGADDYMSGPIDRRAVLDRIFALKPMAANYTTEKLDYGALTINLPAYCAYWRDEPIDVSPLKP